MNGLAMTSGGRLWVSWIAGGDSPDAFTVAHGHGRLNFRL